MARKIDTFRSQSQTGAVIKYASASVEGETPFIDDADTVTASFTPDAVGTYAFTLDVSNVCHAATERFVSSFLCNAEPSEFRADVTRVNPKPEKHASMCLAKQTIEAYVVDADGDDVFVSWSHGAGDEGWDVFVTDEKTLVTNDTATDTNATTDGTAANATDHLAAGLFIANSHALGYNTHAPMAPDTALRVPTPYHICVGKQLKLRLRVS